jgi:hypothetical protein
LSWSNIAQCRCRFDPRIFLGVGHQDLYLAAAKTVAVWTPPYAIFLGISALKDYILWRVMVFALYFSSSRMIDDALFTPRFEKISEESNPAAMTVRLT